jgi:phosphinothricin acetyltransferase
MKPEIRKAKPSDVAAITEIYNEAILTTTATFDIEPKTVASQRLWFKQHGPKNPVLVALDGSDVVGWASLSEYSARCAYANTAELSVYVKAAFRNRGIGQYLMKEVLKEGSNSGLHTAISRIAGDNEVSIHLHKKLGFNDIGVMKEVGIKFGKILDVYLMQKMF